MKEQLKADLSSRRGTSSLKDARLEVPVGPAVHMIAAAGCLQLPSELCRTE